MTEPDLTLLSQLFLMFRSVSLDIFISSSTNLGSEGPSRLALSRSEIILLAISDTPGVKLGIFTRRKFCFEAVMRIFRKVFSTVEQEVGGRR